MTVILAVLFSSVTGFENVFFILLFMGNYFLYSMPPFRFKRVFILSKLVIGFNSLVCVMLGFNLAKGGLAGIPDFIYILTLIGITLASNFIDIKDHEGDRKAGIWTLPTVLGLGRSKKIMGVIFILLYLLFPLLITKEPYLILVSLFFGVLTAYFINKKEYKDSSVLITIIISLIFYLMLLSFNIIQIK
jgi:4-hydroxybenzoate polyprenyltransferase